MFGFEKLDVWRKSLDFAAEIYKATDSFPNDERFGLSHQLRRAAVSVSSNIAEGSGRNSKADFIRFVSFAYGSTMECVSQIHIASRLHFMTDDCFNGLLVRADELARMLSGLKSSLQRSE